MKKKFLIASALILLISSIQQAGAVTGVPARPVELLAGAVDPDEPVRSIWSNRNVKCIDTAGDVERSMEGADLLAFYFDEREGELGFRVSMVNMIDPASGVDLFSREKPSIVILLDFMNGGRFTLPAGLEGNSTIEWDEAYLLDPFSAAGVQRAVCFSGSDWDPGAPEMKRAFIDEAGEYLEGAVSLSGAYLETSFVAMARDGRLEGGEEKSATGGIDSYTSAAARALISSADRTPIRFEVISISNGVVADRLLGDNLLPAATANCAFVHHGNQGLAYSDVFYGRSDDPGGSGFDEALEVHESTSIPGNFHLCAPLQTSTEWDHNNGDPVDFNGWLSAGVTAGWAGMITSAYAQHMMPFVQNDMNDWAVNVETQMTNLRYGYYPRVAWVPERVWLDTVFYPNAGVIDNLIDNWTQHGVWAVILDDDVHCQGYDNHQIHTISGSTLKVFPRDRNFTGKIVGGDGAGALQVLTDMSNSGYGNYRIALYAEDWEAAAEMGSWASSTPNAKETYDWFINKCQQESAWIAVWKAADAVANPDFQGVSMNITYGTYLEIGGTAGYGGGNNGWYTHWAGYVPYANGGDGYGYCDPQRGGNCKNFGTLWNDAYTALMAAPNNNISQAGWYVLMTNLHETAWHDGMGGEISGWELKYSGHMKNAMIYAEASHWANGEYASATGAYLDDIDNDGYDEMIIHNDRVFAVFEGIGGRATNIFSKGSDYNFSIVGVDNAYWAGTEADYNDVNHVALLSDVGPNYQHSLYGMQIVQGGGTTVEVEFTYQDLKKTVRLTSGQPYLDIIYEVGASTQYVQNGYSPGLVDLVWNAQMDRIWVSDAAYYGQRNPNNGATAAIVAGGGGAEHNFDFSGRIMKGDEIYGSGVFEMIFYAGKTTTPDMAGEIAELRALAALTDTIGPRVTSAVYFPGSYKLRLRFNQVTAYSSFEVTGVSMDDDDDGSAEMTLSSGTTVVETQDGYELTLQLTVSDAAVLDGLSTSSLELLMATGTAYDTNGNPNDEITNEDDISISYGELTEVTIDGYIDPAEWDICTLAVDDSTDSDWTAANEIDGLYIAWDSLYLYVALDGIVTSNSWLIYFDVDPGGPDGQTDLTAIDIWERGAIFTYPGFKCDFEYGCYQHQGAYDSDGFYRIESAVHAVDISDSVITAFDSNHGYGDSGGSELAIPWEVLYGLGEGNVPVDASISIVASLSWDPEPDGELGGDSAPNNISAVLPIIDNAYTFTVDTDGNGKPDPSDGEGPVLESAHRDTAGDSLVNVLFNEPVEESSAENIDNYEVYWTTIPSNTLDVISAVLQPDGRTVQLALESPVGYGWTLSVSNLTDDTCYRNVIAYASTVMIRGPLVSGGDMPSVYNGMLYQNYPNPFNPSTVIKFEVPGEVSDEKAAGSSSGIRVELAVYDVSGRIVRTLLSGTLEPGPGSVRWDGTNDRGMSVSSGIYFCRISGDGWWMTRKMVLLR